MRVGLLTTSFPRFPGDLAGGFVAEHAAFLARAGHRVEVIAAGSGEDRDPRGSGSATDVHEYVHQHDYETGSGSGRESGSVVVLRVRAGAGLFDGAGAPEELARGALAWLSAGRFSLGMARAVARRARQWDAIVAHWLVPSALAAIAAAPRLPLLAIAHSGDVHLLRRLRALRFMGALCDRPDLRLSFVSEELRGIFLEHAPRCAGRAQVCSMGIDLARLRAARSARAASPDPTVLFLGRLVPVKGVDVLVRAAHLWRSRARLVIAGAGPIEPDLRRLSAAAPPGRIAFAGPLRGAERDRALASADVVSLPSVRVEGGRSEGLPLVALEAMAAGAALIASSVGGLADLPRAAVTHVPPGDPAALAAAVDHLVLDRTGRAAQIAAQDRLIPAFDWSAVGPRLVPPVRSRSPGSS
jgi:glycosyltransferase involved in cell wall biosynthesis